jgi:hypothetical protein
VAQPIAMIVGMRVDAGAEAISRQLAGVDGARNAATEIEALLSQRLRKAS